MTDIQILQLLCAILIIIIIALCATLSIVVDKGLKYLRQANSLANRLSELLLHELRYNQSENVSRARQALLKFEDETEH